MNKKQEREAAKLIADIRKYGATCQNIFDNLFLIGYEGSNFIFRLNFGGKSEKEKYFISSWAGKIYELKFFNEVLEIFSKVKMEDIWTEDDIKKFFAYEEKDRKEDEEFFKSMIEMKGFFPDIEEDNPIPPMSSELKKLLKKLDKIKDRYDVEEEEN